MSSRLSREDLVDKALLALREAMHQVSDSGLPIGHRAALRCALAVLYTGGDRAPFITFWREATRPTKDGQPEVPAISFGRFQTLRSAMAAISAANGVEPY